MAFCSSRHHPYVVVTWFVSVVVSNFVFAKFHIEYKNAHKYGKVFSGQHCGINIDMPNFDAS